jgi:hypothetical protein
MTSSKQKSGWWVKRRHTLTLYGPRGERSQWRSPDIVRYDNQADHNPSRIAGAAWYKAQELCSFLLGGRRPIVSYYHLTKKSRYFSEARPGDIVFLSHAVGGWKTHTLVVTRNSPSLGTRVAAHTSPHTIAYITNWASTGKHAFSATIVRPR